MKEVQLWTFLPNVVNYLGYFGETFTVYYCVDEWSKFSFMDGKSMRFMEENLMKRADLVITSASHLYENKKPFNENTYLIQHGVDYSYFSKALSPDTKIADELTDIPKPIIGFFGLIHEWIDLELIEYIATARPDWSVVLIGKTAVNLEKLSKHRNIHLLGQRAYEELVSYCKGFDVGMIPFHINEMTVNVNPIKLREYLAAGLPVISTPLPEVEKYKEKEMVSIAETGSQMVREIERLITGDSAEKRLQRSRKMASETWSVKVRQIEQLVDRLIQA
jgi:glycosyltransferase involved in cell wall biosynthesis